MMNAVFGTSPLLNKSALWIAGEKSLPSLRATAVVHIDEKLSLMVSRIVKIHAECTVVQNLFIFVFTIMYLHGMDLCLCYGKNCYIHQMTLQLIIKKVSNLLKIGF